MRVLFYPNSGKPAARDCAVRLTDRAGGFGLDVVNADGRPDVVIALGGDGTILRAVHTFPGVPVLGFNLGGLGYLAAVGSGDFEAALASLSSGSFRISERRMLCVSKEGSAPSLALNDVVLSREMSGRSVCIDLTADGRFVTGYLADGLVFATPTGSTAYSLSAGGPVLLPDSASLVVTPLNPHALGVRPIVIRDDVSFTAVARGRMPGDEVRIGVYADGVPVMNLSAGENVSITRAGECARFVELEGYDPYDVLARKLGWSGSCVR